MRQPGTLGAVALLLAAAGSMATAQVPDWSLQARQRLQGNAGEAALAGADRQQLVAGGEACLASGDIECARRSFEQAASIVHAADVEIGIVRTQMQAGEYRQALAFAAHTAGAHRDSPTGRALYAQLLRAGGQAAAAERVDEHSDAALPAFTPQSLGELVPRGARVAGSALLWPDGTRAVTGLGLLPAGATLWLRDGLGRTVRAELERSDGQLALLRLVRALPASPIAIAPRDPFPGSPGYAVAFQPARDADPAWPALSPGFLGRGIGGGGRWLGIEVPGGAAGAPVFDAAGRLAGIGLPAGDDGRARLAGIDALRTLVEPAARASAIDRPLPRAADEIYELALRQALQLIVLP